MQSSEFRSAFFTVIILIFSSFTLLTGNARNQNECPDTRVYGDENHQNYILIRAGNDTRTIYFEDVSVSKIENSGYLICFPVFGLSPVIPDGETRDPSELLRLIPSEDFKHRLSQINLKIMPESGNPYYFSRSSISSVDCVIDKNRFNPSLEDLMDPMRSEMYHELNDENGKLQIVFNSVSKEDSTFSMQLNVVQENVPDVSLKKDFRAENYGDTLKPRIYLYSNGGFLSYQSRFGLMKIVPLPAKDKMLSGYINKDFASVYEFKNLSDEKVSFRIHKVNRNGNGENRYDHAIMDPLKTSKTTLEDFTLSSDTYEGTVVSAELVKIEGNPVLIDHSRLPEQERFYASPVRMDISNKEIGLLDLPDRQTFPLYKKLAPFRYSLVNSYMQAIELNVNETPDNYFIDIKRSNLENLESEIMLHKLQKEAGAYADPLKDFIVYAGENYTELNKKDPSWWEDQLSMMDVDPPDSHNPQDYFMAIENKYGLNNAIVDAITEEYYNENHQELINAYSLIINMKSNREDTTKYAGQIKQIANEMDIAGIKTQDWFFMIRALEDSLSQKYSDNLISWALKTNENRLKPVTRFTFTTDKKGKVSKVEFLSPSAYNKLKISYDHSDDSTTLGISHPMQGNEKRSFPIGRGINDIHYLLTLLPWYNFSGNSDSDYYFLDTKGTTYGGTFYITPVFCRVNIQHVSDEMLNYAGRETDTHKVRLTFNTAIERPAIFLPELSVNENWQPFAEIWLSKEKPHIPVKMKARNEIYWRGPDPEDKEQSILWYEWMKVTENID